MDKIFHQPLGGNEMPRFAGIATMMRLPHLQTAKGLDAAFVGVPLDIGTSLRAGTRFGPREIRAESVMIRPYNMATGAAPFDSLSVADIGDVAINTFNLLDAVRIIEEAYDNILEHNVIPMTLGGDHTITLPILRAIHKKHGKVGLVHIDAHADVNDHMFGEKIAHGTTFRRAVEEGLLDCDRVVQIGLRAQGYTAEDFNWSRKQGFRVVQAEECWHQSLAPLMAEVREKVGGGPVYLSFDIDGIDPAWAPGTGTPEIGGLTTIQAIEIVSGVTLGAQTNLDHTIRVQQAFFDGATEGGAVGDFLAEHVIVHIGVGVDVHQADLAVLLVNGTQDRQGDGVVAAQSQRDHIVFEDVVVGFFDDPHGIQQVEGVDRDVTDVGHRQGVERRSTGRHVVRADHHRFSADFARSETGAGAQRGTDVQGDADKCDVQAFGRLQVGQAQHGGYAAKARHVVAAQWLMKNFVHGRGLVVCYGYGEGFCERRQAGRIPMGKYLVHVFLN